jgi:hypothetical protein
MTAHIHLATLNIAHATLAAVKMLTTGEKND